MTMNIMISSIGLGPALTSSGGTADGALFVVVFSALGFLLLSVAGCILRGCESRNQSVRYTQIRL